MKSITIHYTSGRITDMMLEDSVYEKLYDWFMNDYSESKMRIESDNTVRILNKNFICEISVTKRY